MGKIQILPDTLISQIAAGEVVERPASVMKELLENSLDAGATDIYVEVEQGGMKLMMVRDNGKGMDIHDAKMAFARHATSKIAAFEDLSRIQSFGFRGEALAAIASVSMMTLRTRESRSNEAFEVVCRGGAFESEGPVAAKPGTEILVRNLFFNTPARRKFLKSEMTELSHIVATVSHMALAFPHVAFELKHNGKSLLSVPVHASPQVRMESVLGRQFAGQLLPVAFQTETLKIHGFIGRPGMEMGSRRHQYIFVNGRDVGDAMISRAVCDGYGTRLPGRMNPVFLLHVELRPEDVDVNIHPRKLAVKFVDTQNIYRGVSQAVDRALTVREAHFFIKEGNTTATGDSVQNALEFSQEKNPEGLQPAAQLQHHFNILGQIANSYILVAEEEGICILDQHAAHERILYERIQKSAREKSSANQPLLVPFSLEVSREEAVFLQQAKAELEKLGFEFDEWSGSTLMLRAAPSNLKSENMERIFREFLNEMSAGKNTSEILPERILKSLACKGAVKFGMQLAPAEQEQLLRDLATTPNSATCPHGRPVKFLLGFEELERKFYR